MPNPLLTILARGSVSSGVTSRVIAGSIVAADQNDDKKPVSKKGAIIGIVVGAVILVVLCIGAYLIDRHRKKKAARGTKIAQVGAMYEEVSPLAGEGYPMAVGGGDGQAPMRLQQETSYQPPQYPAAQGRYPLGPHGETMGQQGTDYYRNQ